MRCHFPVLQAGPGSAVLLVLECVSVTGEEGATWSRGPLSLHEESGTKIGGCTLQWGLWTVTSVENHVLTEYVF